MEAAEKRVLVVEDDDSIRTLLATLLRRRGLHVDTARDGGEALERVRSSRYGIILLDMMMPRVNGEGVLSELALLPEAARPVVIVLTAGPEPRNLDSNLVAGLLRKPFDIQMLVDTVGACLVTMMQRAQRQPGEPSTTDGNPVAPPNLPKPN
ncbi:MAG TPA: response regulator [Thermoanaerobaculia bacterium]|nr:response regulator [Thermoanaerobaculia bacterium]